MFNLIQQAYGLFGFQIVGAPGWLDRERFDIQAIAPGTGFAQQGPLLQKLLEERFAFRARRETRDGEIYALVIARADGRLGPNLRPFTGNCAPTGGVQSPCTMHNGRTFTKAVGMPLSIIVGRPPGTWVESWSTRPASLADSTSRTSGPLIRSSLSETTACLS